MIWRPCASCGEPSPGTRCPDCTVEREARVTERKGSATARGYDARWQRLSARARRMQPFCTDCASTDDLTADHLVWPARTLADVDVVCRPCNSKRGATRGEKASRHAEGPSGEAKFASLTEVMPSRHTVYGLPDPARHRAGGQRFLNQEPGRWTVGELLASPVPDDQGARGTDLVARFAGEALRETAIVIQGVQGEVHPRSLP